MPLFSGQVLFYFFVGLLHYDGVEVLGDGLAEAAHVEVGLLMADVRRLATPEDRGVFVTHEVEAEFDERRVFVIAVAKYYGLCVRIDVLLQEDFCEFFI